MRTLFRSCNMSDDWKLSLPILKRLFKSIRHMYEEQPRSRSLPALEHSFRNREGLFGVSCSRSAVPGFGYLQVCGCGAVEIE